MVWTINTVEEYMTGTLENRLHSLLFLSCISLLAVLIAWRSGLFSSLLPRLPSPQIQLHHTLIAFALFISVQLFIVPVISLLTLLIVYRGTSIAEISRETRVQGWINIFGILGSAAALVAYLRYLSTDKRGVILGKVQPLSHAIKSTMIGIGTWFLAFPLTNVVGQLAAILLLLMNPDANLTVDQAAVGYLKSTIPYPVLLITTIVALVIVVPAIEELLFRGFLQSWLCARWNRWQAILATSVIFAAFHFSTAQGFANIELLPTLFMLSCFLGFLYERERSLLAPIGLHAIFNAISIVMILSS